MQLSNVFYVNLNPVKKKKNQLLKFDVAGNQACVIKPLTNCFEQGQLLIKMKVSFVIKNKNFRDVLNCGKAFIFLKIKKKLRKN